MSWVRGVEAEPVVRKWVGTFRFIPVFFIPESESSTHTVVPEGFELTASVPFVCGWTEHALRVMDRLGIAILPKLYGPVLLPDEKDARKRVRVWVAADYEQDGSDYIMESVVQAVDALIVGELPGLTVEERAFLAWHYPAYREGVTAKYNDAVYRRLASAASSNEFGRPEVNK